MQSVGQHNYLPHLLYNAIFQICTWRAWHFCPHSVLDKTWTWMIMTRPALSLCRNDLGIHLSGCKVWKDMAGLDMATTFLHCIEALNQCLIECNSICQNLIMPIKARPSSQYYLPVKCYWKICSLTAIGSVWPWRIQFVLVKDRVADRVSERAKSLTKLYCRGHSARRKARLVVATARKRG